MDTAISVIVVITGILLALVGIYLGLSPVDPNQHIHWWYRKRTRRAFAVVSVCALLNIVAAIAQMQRGSAQQGKLQGSLDHANGQLTDAQQKLAALQTSQGETKAEINDVLHGMEAGRISSDQAIQLLTGLNLKISVPRQQDPLAVISASATELASIMQKEFSLASVKYDSDQQAKRVDIYRNEIRKGTSANVAASFLSVPAGPGYSIAKNEAMGGVERRIFDEYHERLATLARLTKDNVPAGFKVVQANDDAVDRDCISQVILLSPPGSALSRCSTALISLSRSISAQ